MVFRKENKVDAFQRQISALRHQLGTTDDDQADEVEIDEQDDGPAGTAPVRDEHVASFDPHAGAGPSSAPFSFTGFGVETGFSQPDDMNMPVPPMIPAPLVADTETSVVAHDAIWKGSLQTGGSLHIHGRVEGGLDAKEDIYIADEADVDVVLTAKNVVIAGLVKGTIRCSDRCEVLPHGRVTADIQAPTLVVHEGAVLTGNFRMDRSEPGESRETPTPAASVLQRRAARGGD